jgi:hypothetical protein
MRKCHGAMGWLGKVSERQHLGKTWWMKRKQTLRKKMRLWKLAGMVACLPSKLETLSFKPHYCQKTKQNKTKR